MTNENDCLFSNNLYAEYRCKKRSVLDNNLFTIGIVKYIMMNYDGFDFYRSLLTIISMNRKKINLLDD